MDSLISIIVPVYNAEKTLARCVRSLIGQSHRNIEILLVNDGSKDASLAICRQFAQEDDRIRVIDKPNGGVSSARNAGLDAAKGEFVMFCDSDDWAAEDWCKVLYEAWEPEMLVMCGHFNEGTQSEVQHCVCSNEGKAYYERHEFWKLSDKFFTCVWNKIYYMRIIRENCHLFCYEISNGEDFLFNLQYINSITGGIIYLPESMYHYLWPTGNSLSSSVPKNYYFQVDALYERINQEINRMPQLPDRALEVIRLNFFYQYQRAIDGEISLNGTLIQNIKRANMLMKSEGYRICAQSSKNALNFPEKLLWCSRTAFWYTLRSIIRRRR